MAKIATFYDHIRDMARQEHLFMEDALQRARELGVKPDSVRMALTRARRKARRLMESQHNEQNV